ncbi:MAG: hypothetical protein AAF493_12215 [Pseudomonadota bacterium]
MTPSIRGPDRWLVRLVALAAVIVVSLTTIRGVLGMTPANTTIQNVAEATYDVGGITAPSVFASVSIVTVGPRTPSMLEFLRYAPAAPGATSVSIPNTGVSTSGNPAGPFIPSAPPMLTDGTVLTVPSALPLVPASVYTTGDPIFLRLSDGDQNTDPANIDYVVVTVSVSGDTEILQLAETGPNTGVFTGYLQTMPASGAFDGMLTVAVDSSLTASYVDPVDGSDTATSAALVDPFGVIFDATTGARIDDATVRLVDANTGAPAAVFGDNGEPYPSTMLSGSTVQTTGVGGRTYVMAPGEYRFPFVAPGLYRLEVTAPNGYFDRPSTVDFGMLHLLPGGPYSLGPGSVEQNFLVPIGPAIKVDIPLDPHPSGSPLFVSKTASKSQVGRGEPLRYRVRIDNRTDGQMTSVAITDVLPVGFRYQSGSAAVDGAPIADPTVARNGRRLTFDVGTLDAQQSIDLTYVVQVGATRKARAVNRAWARTGSGLRSNTSSASVKIRDDLFTRRAVLLGRVILNSCDGERATDSEGLAGVRLYLEDGSNVVTDTLGRWHIEGIRPGSHVIHLDPSTLPPGHNVEACHDDTRHAGSSVSRFVDVQGGMVWRTDFHVTGSTDPRRSADPASSTASLKQSLRIIQNGDRVEYELSISRPADTTQTSATIMLPSHHRYRPGPAGDMPEQRGQALVFRLSDEELEATRRFVADIIPSDAPNDGRPAGTTGATKSLTQATLRDGRRVRTPMLTVRPGQQQSTHLDIASPSPDPIQAPQSAAGYDKAWLANASSAEEWVWPPANQSPAIPAVKAILKHRSNHRVELFLNRESVSPLNFDGSIRSPGNALSLSTWRGLDLIDGPNRLVAVLRDQHGAEVARLVRDIHYAAVPVRAELVTERSTLVADGLTRPTVVIRLLDEHGMPVRPGVITRPVIDPPHRTQQAIDRLDENPVAGVGFGGSEYAVESNGTIAIDLAPTTQPGNATLRFRFNGQPEQVIRAWLKPRPREWILVGLAETTFSQRMLSGNQQTAAGEDLDENLFPARDGRVAFFAKGTVRGDWLLPLSNDSDREPRRDTQRLGQLIDPDEQYTLYADATEPQYEAESSSKLYVKVERERFYALYGDINTDLTKTELSRYRRQLTGFKSEYRSDNVDVNIFAADDNLSHVRDELRANGTSGLYRLSRRDLLINSETVTIQVRNRFRSEKVESEQVLARHIDYDIDYDKGTLYFRTPLRSRDDAFNPRFIVVEYETENALEKALTAGGRLAVRILNDQLEVGTSVIREAAANDENHLLGVDATFNINKHTEFRIEHAITNTEATTVESRGEATIAELNYRNEQTEASVYYRRIDDDFGLNQQPKTERGTEKIGAEIRYKISPHISVSGKAFRRRDLPDRSKRGVAEARLDYQQQPLSAHVGARVIREEAGSDDTRKSQQVFAGASRRFFNNRVQARIEGELSLNPGANRDFPSRVLVGGDWKVNDQVTLFAEQDATFGRSSHRTFGTLAGVRATPWKGARTHSSLGRQQTESGERLFSNLGLTQAWQLNDRWSADFSVDRAQTLSASRAAPSTSSAPRVHDTLNEDFTAVSLGLGYRWQALDVAARIEWRDSETENQWSFRVAGHRRLGAERVFTSEAHVHRTDSELGDDHTQANLRFSFAWRPNQRPWTVLNRLDFVYDDTQRDDGRDTSTRVVNNLAINYHASRKTQWSLHYGAKYVLDTIDGKRYAGFVDTAGVEARYSLSRRWDIGARASVLHTWATRSVLGSVGASVGFSPAKNVWLSVGYNVAGYRDRDFSGSEYTEHGPFVQVRLKADQSTLKAIRARLKANTGLPTAAHAPRTLALSERPSVPSVAVAPAKRAPSRAVSATPTRDLRPRITSDKPKTVQMKVALQGPTIRGSEIRSSAGRRSGSHASTVSLVKNERPRIVTLPPPTVQTSRPTVNTALSVPPVAALPAPTPRAKVVEKALTQVIEETDSGP